MARSHWRFVVRDQYGFVIQNAQVNVFQPGTSTAFTGSAFDAVSGGSTVTNPFTSNSQGEVEAWFDTPQVVDVQVTDNSDAAYRAVNGSSATISFTTFTESDEIFRVSTDAPTSHGASSHTDITRQIWLPVHDGVVLTGSGATLSSRGTYPDIIRTLSLPDAATAGGAWAFLVPSDWTSGDLDVEIFFTGATTTSGSVRWNLKYKEVNEGESLVAAGTSFPQTSQAPTTADLLVIEPAISTALTPSAAGELVMITAERLGSDGADNYAAVAHLIGLRISYTAGQ